MSAFIVSKKHIDCIVTAFVTFAVTEIGRDVTDELATHIGADLWRENHASVGSLYRGIVDDAENVDGYRFEIVVADGPTVLKQVQCYRYQSCEHDGWETSRAKEVCELLEGFLERRGVSCNSPGYDGAAWGV